MTRKISASILAVMIAITLSSCGSSSSKNNLSTDGLKKFVENSKKNGDMSYEKTKKAYKGIFPKMKMK